MAIAEPVDAQAADAQRAASARRRQTSFAGDVLKLVSGTTIAQALGVLVTPLLTRLYAPEAFGALALFTSITSIIGVVACLRYELAIMLPESDEEAANLLAVSLIAAVATTVLSIPIATLSRPLLVRLLNAPEVGPYLWLVPPVVFFAGVFSALNCWNSRTKQFGRLAVVRVIGSASTHLAKLAAGLVGHATGGTLIGATLLGSVLSTGLLACRIVRDNGAVLLGSIRPRQMWHGVVRYQKFPLIDGWGALVNVISWQLPALMLTFFFSPAIVGYYSLGLRVLQVPMSLVGSAIGQVFFQRAAEARVRSELEYLVSSAYRYLLLASLFPTMVLGIAGREIFGLMLGANWSEAGLYSQILSIWVIVWFLSSPLSTLYRVLERQGFSLKINVLIIVSRFASLLVGGLLGNVYTALALFSASGFLVYGYYVLHALAISGVSFAKAIDITRREVLWVAPGALVLVLVRAATGSALACVVTSVLLMGAFLAATLRYRRDIVVKLGVEASLLRRLSRSS